MSQEKLYIKSELENNNFFLMFCPLVMFHIENNTPEDTTSAIEDQNFKEMLEMKIKTWRHYF